MQIFLDSASTTKPKKEVIDFVISYLINDKWYNPSSLYSPSVKVKADIEDARRIVADFIHAKPEEIIFESCATEANNHVIRGWDDAYFHKDSVIISTPIEHKSIVIALKNPVLQSKIRYCNVDSNGLIDINSLRNLLEEYNGYHILVTIGAANSEIGTIQPIESIAKLVHSYPNTTFHTDATQLLPHFKIDVDKIGIDLMSASAQKFGGIKSSGFLYKRNGINIMPLVYGSQENELRGGTEGTVGIVAMGEAIKGLDYKNSTRMSLMRDCIIDELEKIGCKLIGSKDNRLPNHVSIMLPDNCNGESVLYMLDMAGIYISTGSACNSRSVEPSHVLSAIGLSNEEAARVIRITFSSDLNVKDMDKVIDEIKKCIKILSMNNGDSSWM